MSMASQVPYEPLESKDVELPERQAPGDYRAPALPPRFIPSVLSAPLVQPGTAVGRPGSPAGRPSRRAGGHPDDRRRHAPDDSGRETGAARSRRARLFLAWGTASTAVCPSPAPGGGPSGGSSTAGTTSCNSVPTRGGPVRRGSLWLGISTPSAPWPARSRRPSWPVCWWSGSRLGRPRTSWWPSASTSARDQCAQALRRPGRPVVVHPIIEYASSAMPSGRRVEHRRSRHDRVRAVGSVPPRARVADSSWWSVCWSRSSSASIGSCSGCTRSRGGCRLRPRSRSGPDRRLRRRPGGAGPYGAGGRVRRSGITMKGASRVKRGSRTDPVTSPERRSCGQDQPRGHGRGRASESGTDGSTDQHVAGAADPGVHARERHDCRRHS